MSNHKQDFSDLIITDVNVSITPIPQWMRDQLLLDPIAYIRRQLADGCAYVILPNALAKRLIEEKK